MSDKNIKIEQLRDLINRKEISDPLLLLEGVASGSDVRKISNIYELAISIDSMSLDTIAREDWSELLDAIISDCKYSPVSLNQSINAAKILSEYLHPKRKQIETVANTNSQAHQTPLTEEEIELFKERFNDEF